MSIPLFDKDTRKEKSKCDMGTLSFDHKHLVLLDTGFVWLNVHLDNWSKSQQHVR